MKIIAVGDLHATLSNMSSVRILQARLLELIEKEEPDFVVLLGDLLDKHEKLQTLEVNAVSDFVKAIAELTPVFITVGNHSMITGNEFLNDNHALYTFHDFENVTIADRVLEREIDGFKFVFVPYVPNGRFLEALEISDPKDERAANWREADLIFCHQEFKGCTMNAISSIEGDEWDEEWPQIVAGHIHGNHWSQSNIYYPGSGLQHAFGESRKAIIPVIDVKKGERIAVREIDLGLPRKRIVRVDVRGAIETSEKIDSIEEGKLVKVKVKARPEEFHAWKRTDAYRKLIANGTRVVLDAIVDTKEREEQTSSFEEIFRSNIESSTDRVKKLAERI